MVVTIIGILAAIVLPLIKSSDNVARAETMASVVRYIRSTIQVHAGAGDTPLTAGGFPAAIDPAWFRGGELPEHTWTGLPLVLETVDGAANEIFPATKTFDPDDPAAANAWYNRTNGHFCARVPVQGDDTQTLAIFNCANSSGATSLIQTTR